MNNVALDARLAMTQLNLNDAWCEALFASGLQRAECPTAEAAADVISRAVRQFGIRGCASRMTQEFGDHPQAAAERMRWARLVVAEITARPRPSPGPHGQYPAPVRLAARRPGLSGPAVSAAAAAGRPGGPDTCANGAQSATRSAAAG